MDGIGTLPQESNKRYKRITLWLLISLCLCLLINSVFSADIFSLIFPQAPGYSELRGKNVTVDYSNAAQGYIMVQHSGSSKRLKTIISYDGIEYKYDQNGYGEYETYPLQFGSGKYTVQVYESAGNKKYARVFSDSFQATLLDPYAAFLCPSQYVWYAPTYNAVSKSFELCQGLTTDKEKTLAIYDYVSGAIAYDYMKALSVQNQTGYLPDPDETLSSRMGICFDYAALMACMLRVQGIPTKLVIGDLIPAGQYHAWNLVYINDQWQLLDATFRNSNYKVSDYAQERFY